MPTPAKPPEVIARVREMIAQGKSQREICEACGISAGLVSQIKNGKYKDREPQTAALPTNEMRIEGDNATFTGTTSKFIRSEADAIREFNIDTTIWFVKSMVVKAWTTAMNLKEDGATTIQNYGVTLKLERLLPYSMQKSVEAVYDRIKKHAPKYPRADKVKGNPGEQFMAVFGLFDIHFGKLCWAAETGEDYDLKIAESICRNAVEDLLRENQHRHVTKILLPFGNDWLHVDSRANTTTRGTPQDVDGRFSKMFTVAKMAAIKAVEMMAAVAPVQVELIPGNHDRTLAECLCHVLDAWFTRVNHVTVNFSPKSRKYVRYGNTLLGLTHGDMVKPNMLPGLMPADAKRDWAETHCHEWITGHGHRSQKWSTMDTDTQPGVVVRQLRALTRTDLWHFDGGYIGTAPGAEVYWYGQERGYAGHAVVPVRGV